MARLFESIKENILCILSLFKKNLGEEKFRQIIFILFCIVLFVFSVYISKNYLITGAYLKFIFIIMPVILYIGLKYPIIIFNAFIFFLPFTEFPMGMITLRFDALSLTNIILAALIAVYFLVCIIKNKIVIPKTYLNIPILLMLIIFISSIIQTRHITFVQYIIKQSIIHKPYYRTIFQSALLIFEISAMYITLSLLKKKEDIEKALKIWIYSATFVSLLGIYGYFGKAIGLPLAGKFITYDMGRLMATLKEPIFFGFYLASTLPLLYSLIITKSKFMAKRALYLCFIIQIIAILLSGSRSSWLAFIVSVIVISIINVRTQNVFKKTVLVVSILVITSLVVFFALMISAQFFSEGVEARILNIFTGRDFSAISRIDAMATAWNMFAKYPLLGAGFGNFYLRFLEFTPPYHDLLYSWLKGFNVPPDASNMYLTVLAENGVVGLSAVLFIFFMLIRNIFKSIKTTDNEYWGAILKGYLGAIFYMLTIYFFISTITLTFIWAMFGVIMAVQRQATIGDGS